ncbi:MAG TPA: potassium channel protein [Verrucomicrobiae bacterium]|nr:potassium channel protein [Verrucomicrobiae bacterium]
MNRFARRFLIIGIALAFTLATGTVGFHLIDHYPLFDAFYMTLTTMTTVGYMEIHPLSQAGRVFNSFLIFFGVTTIFIAIGAMTQTIIELEFGDVIGKRRNKRMIDKLKDHYIICGFGRVGRGAAHELQHAGVPFVVVDIDPDRVERAMNSGMLAVAADSTRDETLRDVGVDRARGLVAALATDADNLFVLLSAKGINPKIYVAARAAEEGAEEKMRRAGADAVFAPYSITGHRLAQSLLRPHVVQFLDFTTKDVGEDIAIEQVRVAESSEMVSRSIKEMQLRKEVGVIVMAIRKSDGRMMFNPPAETAVEGGDYLIVMGRPDNLRALEALLAGARPIRR